MLRFVYQDETGKERFINADNINEARLLLRQMKIGYTKLYRTMFGKKTYRGKTSINNVI